ncbi:MAG: hypothetical protein BMS9Abin33_1301 [Gammaproteobacteria bacterium]|nr:MAG: hypothetical protein BMS9Abin33_1301 [Gammaproteobacteria bacterium]
MENSHIKTQRSHLLAIFGLLFFLVGAGFLFMSIIPGLYDGWRMQSWSSMQAQLLSAGLVTVNSSDNDTYRAEARYRYTVNGNDYANDRVSISSSADNIGDFQKTLGRRLENYYRNAKPVRIWFDPSRPGDSIVNRDIRWGLIGFKMIFVLVFGGMGFALIYFGLRGKKVNTAPAVANQPWLKNPDWKDGQIRSSAKAGMVAIWIFALLWNLISAPAVFQIMDIWQEKGAIVLVVLLFPLIGLGLLYWVIKLTLEWRKFGRSPMKMDPFPGSIGGDVAGSITLNMRYDPAQVYKVTLSCLYSYISGSGKNRSRSKKVIWQDSGYARAVMDTAGVKLDYRFQVPVGLNETEDKDASSYHLWNLNLLAEMEGSDLDRDFELPVYATAESSKKISMLSSKEQPTGVSFSTIDDILPITRTGRMIQISYPIFRKPLSSVMMLIFGAVFSGSSLFLWAQAESEGGMLYFMSFMLYFMSFIFGLAGLGIVIVGLYMVFNSLLVTLDGQKLTSRRSILGIPVSDKIIDYDDVLSVKSKKGSTTQKGKKYEINYRIVAKYIGGEVTLAESLNSYSKANQAVEYFKAHLRE